MNRQAQDKTETPYNQEEVRKAFETIKAAMVADTPEAPGSYAHSWHCNIAMACADAIHEDHTEAYTSEDAARIGNKAASRFMKLCFGVETVQ